MPRTRIEECLAPLVARWRAEDLGNNTDGVLQYILTEPAEDGVTGIVVTFEGKSLRAEIGTVESPTAMITMTAATMLGPYADTNGPQACGLNAARQIRVQGDKRWVMRIHAAS